MEKGPSKDGPLPDYDRRTLKPLRVNIHRNCPSSSGSGPGCPNKLVTCLSGWNHRNSRIRHASGSHRAPIGGRCKVIRSLQRQGSRDARRAKKALEGSRIDLASIQCRADLIGCCILSIDNRLA